MTRSRSKPSPERLRELLSYDAETGVLSWREDIRSWNGGLRKFAGRAVTCINSVGYVVLSVDGVKYGAHRVIWCWAHGEWPSEDIDHINGVRTDNRLRNLRCASRSMNNVNRKPQPSALGVRGVCFRAGKYEARAKLFGKHFYLGRFPDLQRALAARVEFEQENFGEFCQPRATSTSSANGRDA